jgi:DNA-directed RNA polymerase III subunit RPC2
LTTGPQLLLTFGLLTGYFTCYGTANIDSSLSWRTPFIILASLSVAFAIVSFLWLVQSPRWLTLRGRAAEAEATWLVLQVDEADRDKTEAEYSEQDAGNEPSGPLHPTEFADQEKTALPQDSPKDRRTTEKFFDVFSSDVRARTLLAVCIMGMQQLSGIDGVLYVSSETLHTHPSPTHDCLLTSSQSTPRFSSSKPASAAPRPHS